MSPAEKPRHSLTISNVRTMNYYTLTARNDREMNGWIAGIKLAIAQAKEAKRTESVEEKRGVLKKKGKQRFFILNNDSLIWFLQGGATERVGFL